MRTVYPADSKVDLCEATTKRRLASLNQEEMQMVKLITCEEVQHGSFIRASDSLEAATELQMSVRTVRCMAYRLGIGRIAGPTIDGYICFRGRVVLPYSNSPPESGVASVVNPTPRCPAGRAEAFIRVETREF